MQFDFATASRIIFKEGSAKDIPTLAASLGQRPCLVTGSNPGRTQWLTDALISSTTAPHIIQIIDEPDTGTMTEAAEQARAHGCDMVIGIGGGSVMDAAKIIAALVTNTDDLFDYLEIVGKGQPLANKPIPLITAPTTAGTGSEVTANGVLLSKDHGVKVSLRSTDMIADIAVVDPELALSVPPKITAATGMDALTQLIEAYVSVNANPMTDSLCKEGIEKAGRSLKRAFKDGNNIEARTDMALASLFSGIALANAKLGAVHGFAAPLGGEFHIPHGIACAALLPHVMTMNLRVLQQRGRNGKAINAYGEIARILTGNNRATSGEGIQWIKDLSAAMNIPRLSQLGVSEADFPALAEKAANASSMKGNPIELTKEELMEILTMAF